MDTYTFVAPCHFGLESVLKRELQDLGCEISLVEDGRVTFRGGMDTLCRANIFLRTAERVLLQAGRFRAESFDELFENIKAIPWEAYIPADGKFWVTKATSVKSRLFSPSDIQSIVKKAMVERLKQRYGVSWFPESGASYPVRITFLKDEAVVGIDTSGVSLHKRGYRRLASKAPITETLAAALLRLAQAVLDPVRITFLKDEAVVGIDTSGESLHRRGYRKLASKAPITETLAAALLMLTPWRGDRILVDPFCGSGTFPIEAAMMAAHMAPGVNRSFAAEEWKNLVDRKLWYEAVTEANDLLDDTVETDIQGYDIDPDMVKAARENARDAGVDHLIHFQARPVSELRHPKKYGFLVTNPPYGERLEEKEALPALYREIGEAYGRLDSWSMYLITAYEDAERYIGRKADKNRKIYNGMLKTYFYQYLGPKPPRRQKQET